LGSFSSPWVREQLPSLATFKKAFRARTTLIHGKQSGKVPEEVEASSAHVYTMQAISLPFDSSRNLFFAGDLVIHGIQQRQLCPCRGTKPSSYTPDALAAEYILPFSKVWASKRPYGAPLAGITFRRHLHRHSCPPSARLDRLRYRHIRLTRLRRLQLRYQRRTSPLFSSPNRSPLSPHRSHTR